MPQSHSASVYGTTELWHYGTAVRTSFRAYALTSFRPIMQFKGGYAMSEDLQWQNRLSIAVQLAKEEKKLILIDFFGAL